MNSVKRFVANIQSKYATQNKFFSDDLECRLTSGFNKYEQEMRVMDVTDVDNNNSTLHEVLKEYNLHEFKGDFEYFFRSRAQVHTPSGFEALLSNYQTSIKKVTNYEIDSVLLNSSDAKLIKPCLETMLESELTKQTDLELRINTLTQFKKELQNGKRDVLLNDTGNIGYNEELNRAKIELLNSRARSDSLRRVLYKGENYHPHPIELKKKINEIDGSVSFDLHVHTSNSIDKGYPDQVHHQSYVNISGQLQRESVVVHRDVQVTHSEFDSYKEQVFKSKGYSDLYTRQSIPLLQYSTNRDSHLANQYSNLKQEKSLTNSKEFDKFFSED